MPGESTGCRVVLPAVYSHRAYPIDSTRCRLTESSSSEGCFIVKMLRGTTTDRYKIRLKVQYPERVHEWWVGAPWEVFLITIPQNFSTYLNILVIVSSKAILYHVMLRIGHKFLPKLPRIIPTIICCIEDVYVVSLRAFA